MKIPLLVLLMFFSCQPIHDAKRPYDIYKQPKEYFSGVISANEQVVLANDSYPIYLILKPDKTFSYDLPRLGQGEGEWSYNQEEGSIHLFASRIFFVMDFDIRSTAEEVKADNLALEFSDRFGPKFLHLKIRYGH